MVQSYKKKLKLNDTYDAILIGSGMGSLTAGALLAKEGKKVLILEKHYTAGGFTHVFKRKGYEWDVGIHYIGEVQRPNSPVKRLFDYITDRNLKWADMGQVYDRIIIGNKKYDFVKGPDNFKNQLFEYFPDEKEAIETYIFHIIAANKTNGSFYASKAIPVFLNKIIGWKMRKKYLKYSDKTTYEVISSLTQNKELIKVLTGQYGDYGLPPKQSSFVMHAAVVKHYFHGGSFPIGGSSQIVNTIAPIITNAGGAIVISADVKEVIIKKNQAKGVLMADGKSFYSDIIISGAGVINTFKKLIPEKISSKYGLLDQLQKIKPSVSHASLYIGLNGSPEELELPKTNLWIYPKKGDHDTLVSNYVNDLSEPFPVVYVSFPSAKDPDWPNRYPSKSTIDIITLLPYDRFSEWEGSKWMKRGVSYDEFKESISKRLFEELFKQLPHLRDKIDHYELSSPLTTQHFVNYDKGEIYGIDHTPDRFRQKFLQPRTPIKGLYLTGQDIVTAGVGGALFSGLITSSAITGINFMKKIYE
jgi:all-trans-retinol 13,14-reductase